MSRLFNRIARKAMTILRLNDVAQDLSDKVGAHAEIPAHMPALCRTAAASGAVLLKNNGALPIREGETVSVFGRCARDYFFVGYGSGGDVIAPYHVDLIEGLRNGGVRLNESLVAAYDAWRKQPRNEADPGFWGNWPRYFPEMPMSPACACQAAKESDMALVVIGRAAGEDRENKLERGSYYLTRAEEALLETVCAAFSRVAVVVDTGNVIDLSWAEKAGIGALLLAWQGGMESGNALCDVLCGRISPCGKLPDTIARRYEDYPSARYFGKRTYNEYVEDIFIGYRYFETFAPEKVLYPFGYGLSYTTFCVQKSTALQQNGAIVVTADVTNTGAYAGMEVVQLYLEAPQGLLGKPARSLCAFSKTRLLQPGEKQSLVLTAKLDDLASFDESGVTGFHASFVLEAGEYRFHLGTSVRDTEPILSVKLTETRLVRRLSDALGVERGKGFLRMVNRNGTLSYEPVPTAPDDRKARILAALPPSIPQTGDRGIKLVDVANGSATMEAFVSQLSNDELEAISRGNGMMNSPLGASGNAGTFGGVTASLRQKGVPPVVTSDGPAGIRLRVTCSLLPCGACLAATWDTALIHALCAAVGDEMHAREVDVLLAPGMNIHRDPLCGRNFEYYSEDPLLCGKIAAAFVRGLQQGGLSACPKHFACNNQETNRTHNDSRVSARALREIYLRGFEICVTDAKPLTLMSSYNKINGVWGHYHYDLLETVLRKEWGFDGCVLTDWWMRYAPSPEFPKLRGNAYRVRARADILMPGGKSMTDRSGKPDGTLLESLGKPDGITLGELQSVAMNVLGMILRSSALTRFEQNRQA